MWLQRAFRGEIAPVARLVLVCLIIALALVTAYFNGLYPVARLSVLGFVYVIAIDTIGGLAWGIFGAGALALTFTLTEFQADPIGQGPYLLSTIAARFAVFTIVVLLVEAVRRQTLALNESQLRQRELELERMRLELAEATARFRSFGESIPFGVWHCDADGRVIYMSPSFLQLVGMTLEEVRQGGWLSNVVPEDAERVRAAWRDRHAWDGVWEDEYRIKGVDGKMYAILCRGLSVHDSDGHVVGWTGLNLDLTERSHARDQMRFLVEAGRLLSMSLDPSTTLERVANLTVPRIADWCIVETLQDNGELQTVSLTHADPTKLESLRELRGYPRDTDDSRGALKVLRTGESEVYEDIDDKLLQAAARDERHLALLRSIGMRSAVVVAMRARDRVLGVMTLVHAESGRRFTPEDVRLVEILAARAALAYDNARNYSKEQRVADTFQRASLPMSLPQLPGIHLNATYLPGAAESEVGGDWYDAFLLPSGQLAISIGDVAGKGLRAAVSMASTRPALRGCALEGLSPREVLERINQQLTYEGAGMVTALFGVLDPVNLELTFATAGHPSPLVAHRDGHVEKLRTKGLPLGLFADSTYEEKTVILEPGSLLVCYTDGLIEFDHNIIEGEKILHDAVVGEMRLQTPDPSAAIVRRVILGSPQDDVAVLTVSISNRPLDHVNLSTNSAPASARVIRQALRRFALSIGLDDFQTVDLLTASGEAISNVIEHAYGIDQGPLYVMAFRDKNELVVKVSDHGQWRTKQKAGSGRGLPLMRALMNAVEVEHGEKGTTVQLRMSLLERTRDRSSKFPVTSN
ncbi:MAG TPA: SpoIIE family protein phosphatase [Candidatus Eremiobacteraceae bacterium]|nr:SpoIIE family protein phosphatase [Candidatus Eremiobacteraceae bacterium]